MNPESRAEFITVQIAAYNAAAFIEEALQSIASQTRPVDRVIVVDDGSTDDTAARVEAFARRGSLPIELLRQSNSGWPTARNRAIEEIQTGWVAFLDADDLWLPHHLAALEEVVRAAPQAIAVFADGVYFEKGRPDSAAFSRTKAIAAGTPLGQPGLYTLNERLFSALLPGSFIIPSSLMVRTSALKEIGGFDTEIRYHADRHLLLRLAKLGDFAFLDRVISKGRIHANNITHPKNTARNELYSLILLSKLSTQLKLSSAETEHIEAQKRRTFRQGSYSASTNGWGSYLHFVRAARSIAGNIGAPRLKDIARATLRSFVKAEA